MDSTDVVRRYSDRPRLMLCAGVLVALCTSSVAASAPSAHAMYAGALAREQAARAAFASPDGQPGLLVEVRAVAAAYEAIVKRYPASGYSDDALWQAGRLLLDAFVRFGDEKDRTAGVRLLKRLASGYPTSKLVKLVPDELARVADSPASTPQVVRATAGTAPAAGAAPPKIATIRNITRSVLADAVRVTIELDAEVPFHQERIPGPERVFLDLVTTRATSSLVDQTIRFEKDDDVVRQIRIGRHPNNVTRVVLDAAGVSSYSIYPLYEPYRLVVDCIRQSARPAVMLAAREREAPKEPAPVPPLFVRRSLPSWTRTTPSLTSRHRAAIAAALAASIEKPVVDSPTPIAAVAPALVPAVVPGRVSTPPAPAAAPAPLPSKTSTGSFSIARQLGLGVSRIVIDPGHGGHDSGAQARGVTEAELVLDVALRLEKLLEKVPGLEVVLTRRTDEFIALQERTAIANREGADLFLSIHANASPVAQARGIETYFLNFASNLSAAAVAARENAASGQAMGALPDFVKAIALNNKLEESRELATEVQHTMLERLRPANKTIKDLGVKQAPFVVLIGAAMPSVLAEISFVTNPQEARLLKGGAYRQRIADALCEAIQKYQVSLRKAQTVALQ